MDLSIVIVNWNTCRLLRECLRSLAACAGFSGWQCIVVDNASTDGSAEMVAREFPQVELIGNDSNAGFGAANNQGIRAAAGRYILFLNSDTVVPDHALTELVRFMQEHPQAGACGPRLARPDGHAQSFAFGGDPTPGYLLRRGLSRRLFKKPLHDWETKEPQTVDWVSGASLLIRNEALQRAGGFDEDFFMYFEDNDLCLRLRRAGFQIWYDPQVTITHLGGASLAQSAVRTGWYDASLRCLYAKHYTPLARLTLEILLPLYRRMA